MDLPNSFWDAFWPNLASTLVGILIGIPLALWINRSVLAQSERARKAADQLRVAHALQVLEKAISHNLESIKRFEGTLAQQRTLVDVAVDTSAWDAVKSDLTTELSDPELRRRAAYYFSRCATLVSLNDEYLNFIVGVGASMSSAQTAKQGLHTTLTALVNELATSGTNLLEQVSSESRQLQAAAEGGK